MTVWEVVIDEDCTTRSSVHSYGLFSTERAAKEYLKKFDLKVWQYGTVRERKVIE